MIPKIICGVDEAGRGPIAGPVTAGAVILTGDFPFHILKDSKQLSHTSRDYASIIIRQLALDWAIGWAWPEEIDELNIHKATLLAMTRAIRGLSLDPHLILVDGLFVPAVLYECRAIVKGDTLVPEIMAASIIAKTARDTWMIRYGMNVPEYEFHLHKGYPTKRHRILVKEYGMSPIHRKSFRITFPE
ncbi:MAG: ribonuclease HII [Spirochaetales bacterium]|nr:ribonuclease HII [Spirochaetales bacterium]